jgi:hypothetical protein
MKWFNYWWWQYLLLKPAYGTPRLVAIYCRLRNHPYGVVWYSPMGLEPDMSCKNCGDNLG